MKYKELYPFFASLQVAKQVAAAKGIDTTKVSTAPKRDLYPHQGSREMTRRAKRAA